MLSSTSLLVCATLAVLGSTSPAKSSSPPPVLLPKPTGPYKVGLSIAELVDYGRFQPFAPTAEHVRLMISVFYPITHHNYHTISAEYMPPETALIEDMTLSSLQGLASPNGTFEKLSLHLASPKAKTDVACSYPLVLFAPGQDTTRLFYSQIASSVASLGYTVVTIDIPYDVDLVQYPDGSFAKINLTFWNSADLETAVLAVQTRIQDASFVLDSLSNTTFAHSLIPNLSPSGLNTSHVAMFGHSLGGATAYSILGADDRIVGGLDMDGTLCKLDIDLDLACEVEILLRRFYSHNIQELGSRDRVWGLQLWRCTYKTDADTMIDGPGVPLGTTKPFMLIGHEGHTRETDPFETWETAWTNLTGWKRDINIAGTMHYDFSDYPLVFERLGIMPTNQTIKDGLLVGSMGGERALKIVTTYVGAFLGYVLYGKKSTLLDGPVEEFPEVSFEY